MVICMVFTLFGCENGEENVDNGLKVGFEVSSGDDPSPSDFCAYSSEVSEFDINDVTLEFFYGGLFNINIEDELNSVRNIPYVELYFDNKEMVGEPYLIRRTTESYISEKYRCEMIVDEDWNMIGIDFNHFEQITIPKELFVGSSGKIYFYIFGNNIREIDNNGRILSSIAIYYRLNNDKIILSGEEIKE